MTISEALSIPKGMDFEEYEKLIKEKARLEKSISNLSNKIDFENDSLDVLSDEAGSDRYDKHLKAKQKAKSKLEKEQARLKDIKGVLAL